MGPPPSPPSFMEGLAARLQDRRQTLNSAPPRPRDVGARVLEPADLMAELAARIMLRPRAAAHVYINPPPPPPQLPRRNATSFSRNQDGRFVWREHLLTGSKDQVAALVARALCVPRIAPKIDGNGNAIPLWRWHILQRRLDSEFAESMRLQAEDEHEDEHEDVPEQEQEQEQEQEHDEDEDEEHDDDQEAGLSSLFHSNSNADGTAAVDDAALLHEMDSEGGAAAAVPPPRECIVCYAEAVATRLDGCGHQMLCVSCTKCITGISDDRGGKSTCPVCRTAFEGYLCSSRFGYCDGFTSACSWTAVQQSGDVRVVQTMVL